MSGTDDDDTIEGIRIVDMPDLGVVTDGASFVGEYAGSGRFTAPALKAYIGTSTGGGGGIPEAPADGQSYLRRGSSQSWVANTGTGGGIPDAPLDGALYGRQNAHWAVVTASGGIPDAPIDSTTYGRNNGAWLRVNTPTPIKQWINVQDPTYGAKGDGTTDDTVAVQAAFTAGQTAGAAAIYFPAGTYKLSAQITFAFSATLLGVSIFGDGIEVTHLLWAAGGGIKVTYHDAFNSVDVHGLSFECAVAGGSTVGLTLTNPALPSGALSAPTNIHHCAFKGSGSYDAPGSYWGWALTVYQMSNVNFDSLYFAAPNGLGNGISVAGTSGNTPCVFNCVNCVWTGGNVCFTYGSYVQGSCFTQCNMTGCNVGILVPTGETGLDQLAATGCQFGTAQAGIRAQTQVSCMLLSNNLFINTAANGVGVSIASANVCQITGNSFVGIRNGDTALVITTTVGVGGAVVGNNFNNWGTDVNLGTGTVGFQFVNNNYFNSNAQLVNGGGLANQIHDQVTTFNGFDFSGATMTGIGPAITLPAGLGSYGSINWGTAGGNIQSSTTSAGPIIDFQPNQIEFLDASTNIAATLAVGGSVGVGFSTAGVLNVSGASTLLGSVSLSCNTATPLNSKIPGWSSLVNGQLEGWTNAGVTTLNVASAGANLVAFYNSALTTVGTITWSGSNVSYNTSSDYRIKTNIAPMTGGLERLSQLKPVTFEWIDRPDATYEGFLAHEAQAVVPTAVHGTKDAVDADGQPVIQGLDPGKMVALVVAALQELSADFNAYKAAHP
jgi:hypothetical protein